MKAFFSSLILNAFMPLLSAAGALTSTDFVRTFPQLTDLQKAAAAYEICGRILTLPLPTYVEQVEDLGKRWASAPVAGDYLLTTCNSMWTSRILNPTKAAQIGRAQKIAAFNFLDEMKTELRVRIRMFNDARPASAHGTLPAPFEILNGMSSSARELDETLQHQITLAKAGLAAMGAGAVIEVLHATGTLAKITTSLGFKASESGLSGAVAFTLLSAGIMAGADLGVWWMRKNEVWKPVREVILILDARDSRRPLAPLLEEYYLAVERLGYFYSFNLFLAESGSGEMAEANERCHAQLRDFFDQPERRDWSLHIRRQTVCGDAAAVWASASQYLAAVLPDEPLAMRTSDRLMARAKRTWWSYVETEAYKADMPVCVPMHRGSSSEPAYNCRDRKSGVPVL